MTTLFVANTTLQKVKFMFRIPGRAQTVEQDILPGGQIRAYKDNATWPEIEAIIKQHEKYGLIDVKDIDRTKDYIGLCYSIDAPIEVSKIAKALKHNEGIKIKEGEEFRKQSALALNDALQTESDGKVSSLTVEVQEELKRGASDVGMGEQIVKVQNTSERSSRPRRKK